VEAGRQFRKQRRIGAYPPFPDCELTRMTASYVPPTSAGSIGRYGMSQMSSSPSFKLSFFLFATSIPFLIAS
jgi:hypothetical protein